MKEDIITLQDITTIIRKYALSSIIITVVTTVAAILIAYSIPKKFRTKAILNIQSNYFRNPLVSDLIPESSDPAELNAQRNALLRLSMNDTFLDSIGEKYKLYKSTPNTSLRDIEREGLLKKIEYYSLNATNFQITVTGKTALLVYEITKDVLKQMTFTLIEERYKTIIRARDAIQNQVDFLARIHKHTDAFNSSNTNKLRDELDKINANISALKKKFTDNHPELSVLRQKQMTVRERLKQSSVKDTKIPSVEQDDDITRAFVSRNSNAPVNDIYNDLLRKLSYLSIVLEMEKDRDKLSYLNVLEEPKIPAGAFFPNKQLFAIFGLATGIVISIILGIFSELKRITIVTPEKASDVLGFPLLGTLPPLAGARTQLLLEGTLKKVNPSALSLPHNDTK
jgi:capsular polysaccharide biosynthesis protein